MAPPSYSDIGKQARDVFGKGYHFGLVKLDAKSKIKEHGLSLTEKWNTDNSLNTTVDYDKLCDGLKLTLDGSFQPNSGDKAGKFTTEYKHEKFLFNSDVNLASNPVVNMSTTVGHGPYALGYQTAFDTGKSVLTKHCLAVSFNSGDMILHGTANDSKQFGGGVFLKNSPKLETGVTIAAGGGAASSFAIGAKYTLGPDASLRAKVNNASQIGLSYQQKLRDGITVTMSTNLDGTKLNEPGHKLGLAIEMEA